MTTDWTPYTGAEGYLDYPAVVAWCRALAAARPGWVRLDEIGHSREGRPLLLLTVGDQQDAPERKPAVWLDGGTHAAEWTGVMSTLYTLSQWIGRIDAGEDHPFSTQTTYVLPCMSPDGFQHMMEGGPFVRSSLRPPLPGTGLRVGLEAQDIDGDGEVLWMRWRHPAGPFVDDDAGCPRLRRLTDEEEAAYFLCAEGLLLRWDGQRWGQAPLLHGQDLNRNFPVSWAPFSMFGMDAGAYTLSEPESRAAMDAFAARPNIAAAISNHTFTGALLTQPYRADTPLGEADIRLMERLGEEAVRGTGYRLFRVHPDFTYDPKQVIIGVWADALSTTMGVPSYTLELWDPFAWAGVTVDKPAQLFRKPDPATITALFQKALAEPGGFAPWRPFDHPQLGPVELGGLRHLRTIRNPPDALLAEECQRAFTVVDRVRMALPRLRVRASAQPLGGEDLYLIEVVAENVGFLSTSAMPRGAAVDAAAPVQLTLALPGDGSVSLAEAHAAAEVSLGHLRGWGADQVGAASVPIYPGLSPVEGSCRGVARWRVRGSGAVEVRWSAGRAGSGALTVALTA